MDYYISSRDYLDRALTRLREDKIESLFYAALELRCGIEARMQEYLEVWEHISKKEKEGWRIAALGASVKKAFKTDKIVTMTIFNTDSKDVILCLNYTPVTSRLQKAGAKLGNYLHAMKKYKKAENPFWQKFKKALRDTADQLQLANKGNLLGPPLMHKETGQIQMAINVNRDREEIIQIFSEAFKLGSLYKAEIKHLDQLP